MSVLLDTHAWLWWTAAPERLSELARERIEAAGSIGLAAISCWEVVMLARRGRIRLDREPERWIRQALLRPGLIAHPLTPDVAVAAASLPAAEFPADPADRFIYATARRQGATLITRDRRLRGFDPRGTLW